MKKVIFTMGLIFMLVFTSVTAFAQPASEIAVTIDSVKVEFNEQSGLPFIDENSRTLVPFNKTLTAYGATVDWNGENRIATAEKDGIKVEVPIGQNYIIVNGEQKAIDTAAKIVNNRTFLPIKAVVEAFGSQVEWDQDLKTVVITTTPVDAKAIFTQANNKSNDWKNYDATVAINISMPTKDEEGNVQNINMDMNMDMTIFMDPVFKAKVNSSIAMNVGGQEVVQPVMDMYMVTDDKSFTTYTGVSEGKDELTWTKSTVEDETLTQLLKYNEEAIKADQELNNKYIKDVKYFGKYNDDAGRTLLRMQYTMSGEIYNDIYGEYLKDMPAEAAKDDMTDEILKVFANGNFGDLTYIVYIDEATGQIVKFEMNDLSNIVNATLESMGAITEDIPKDEMELIKQMKLTMDMEISNINSAKDFEIPKEALDAPEVIGADDSAIAD